MFPLLYTAVRSVRARYPLSPAEARQGSKRCFEVSGIRTLAPHIRVRGELLMWRPQNPIIAKGAKRSEETRFRLICISQHLLRRPETLDPDT